MCADISLNFDRAFFDEYATFRYYLSRGASGNVYGPIDWNDMRLAVKQITFAAGKVTEEFRKDIEMKKEIWTSLKHKNLIRIHSADLSQLPIVMFVVMEFAAGGSLDRTLRSLGPGNQLSVDVVTDWAKQIADGMLYLHQRNIVHRDLKSSNILLTEPFDIHHTHKMMLKITDFDEIKEHDHTTTMSLVGTAAYMAPEVLATQRFSKASDVWSYGVVIWEMLSGDIPHKGLKPSTILYKSFREEMEHLPLEQSFPEDYKPLITRCWGSTCEDRPSFQDILSTLQQLSTPMTLCPEDYIKTKKPMFPTRYVFPGLLEHGQIIQGKYNQLVGNLSCLGDIISAMYEKEKLTQKEFEKIHSLQSTPITANEELLNIIARKSRDVFECFLSVIKDTNQLHLYQMVVSGDDTSDRERRESALNHKDSIRRNFMWLSENMDAENGLISLLYQNNVLTVRERESIFCFKDSFQKNDFLLGMISKKSLEDFEKFLGALDETNQGHLAKRLRESGGYGSKTGVTTDDYPTMTDHNPVLLASSPIDRILQNTSKYNKMFIPATGSGYQFTEKKPMLIERSVRTGLHYLAKHVIELQTDHRADNVGRVKKEGTGQLPGSVDYKMRLKHDMEEDGTATTVLLGQSQPPTIYGLAILKDEVFVSYLQSYLIAVYNSTTFNCIRTLTVIGLTNPEHIVSCSTNHCLYAIDWSYRGMACEILRIDPYIGKVVKDWGTHEGGGRLSVASDTNIILNVNNKAQLNEYTANGKLLRMINLASGTDIVRAWHALKLDSGLFVVCHGGYDDPKNRVCLLSISDNYGFVQQRLDTEVLRTFGDDYRKPFNNLMRPMYLAVDKAGSILVCDAASRRLLLLNSCLEEARLLIPEEHAGFLPWRVCVDESNGRYLLADYNRVRSCKLLSDGSLDWQNCL